MEAHSLDVHTGRLSIKSTGALDLVLKSDLTSWIVNKPAAQLTPEDQELARELIKDPEEAKKLVQIFDSQIKIQSRYLKLNSGVVERWSADQIPELSFSGQIENPKEFAVETDRNFGQLLIEVQEEGSQGTWPLVVLPGKPAIFTLESSSALSWLGLLWMGIVHILPLGFDHILFITCLYLLSQSTIQVVKQLSLFTVAHTITLGLGASGLVQLNPKWVEPIIALSIVLMALEVFFVYRNGYDNRKNKSYLSLMIFGFGLFHGLGFAGVFSELNLSSDRFLKALLTFNVGVELGQIAVVVFAFLALGWTKQKDGLLQRRVGMATASGVAAIGLFWTIQRIL